MAELSNGSKQGNKERKSSSHEDPAETTTNLQVACSNADLASITSILSNARLRRSENSRRDNHNWTPLHHVMRSGDLEGLRLMIESPYVPVYAKTFEGQTVLHLAMKFPTTTVAHVELLLRAHPELIDSVNNEEVSTLQHAIKHNRDDLARTLIKIGKANVNHLDLYMEHALFYAVRAKNCSMVEYLLSETDANIEQKNDRGVDLISVAIFTHRKNMFSKLSGNVLRLLFWKKYELCKSIDSLFGSINLSIQYLDEGINQWILEHLFIDPINNTCYANIVKQIMKSPTLRMNSILALCIPLHSMVYTCNTSNLAHIWKHYGKEMQNNYQYVLYCMFTLMLDDYDTYRQCKFAWYRCYVNSTTPDLRMEEFVDVITSNEFMNRPLLQIRNNDRQHTPAEFIQFIKELHQDPAMHVAPIDRVFEHYVRRVKVEGVHNAAVLARLLMYVTEPVPYTFLCTPDRLSLCRNTYHQNTGDIYEDMVAFEEVYNTPTFPILQPNSLFNLARTTIRTLVLSKDDSCPDLPKVLLLWNLELPLQVRKKLIYKYSNDDFL